MLSNITRHHPSLPRYLIVAFLTLILLKSLTKDYALESKTYLKLAGHSEDEINLIIPKSGKEKIDDYKKAKEESILLVEEVKLLRMEVDLLKRIGLRVNEEHDFGLTEENKLLLGVRGMGETG